MLHAWSAEQRLLLGQLAVDGKSNEITAVPELLELLSLKGGTVTADALNCQRAVAAKVVEQGGNYVLALKGNQGRPHKDVRTFPDDPARPTEAAHIMVNGDHGRIGTRAAWPQPVSCGCRSSTPSQDPRRSARSSAYAKQPSKSAQGPPTTCSARRCPPNVSTRPPVPVGA